MVDIGYSGRSHKSMHQIFTIIASNKETIPILKPNVRVCRVAYLLKNYLIEYCF